MQYNSESNNQDIVSDIDYWAGTNSTTYSIQDKTRNANFALDRVTALIMRSDTTWRFEDFNNTDLPIGTTDTRSGQSDYSLSVTHLKINRVRVVDQNGTMITLDPKTRGELSDDDLRATGVPTTYDVVGGSVIVNPTPDYDATAGMEVEVQRGLAYFSITDTEKAPGYASQFHRLISLYAALDHCEANGKDQRVGVINTRIQSMEQELIEFYADRDRDHQPSMKLEQTLEHF